MGEDRIRDGGSNGDSSGVVVIAKCLACGRSKVMKLSDIGLAVRLYCRECKNIRDSAAAKNKPANGVKEG